MGYGAGTGLGRGALTSLVVMTLGRVAMKVFTTPPPRGTEDPGSLRFIHSTKPYWGICSVQILC